MGAGQTKCCMAMGVGEIRTSYLWMRLDCKESAEIVVGRMMTLFGLQVDANPEISPNHNIGRQSVASSPSKEVEETWWPSFPHQSSLA